MSNELQLIAEAFYRTNIMSWDNAQQLAGLAVTIYENNKRKPDGITNPDTFKQMMRNL